MINLKIQGKNRHNDLKIQGKTVIHILVQSSKFKVQSSKFKVPSSKFKVPSSKFNVPRQAFSKGLES